MKRTLLGRTLLITIALGLLAVSAANGSPKHSAKSHREHHARARAVRRETGKLTSTGRAARSRQTHGRVARHRETRTDARRIAARRPSIIPSSAAPLHAARQNPAEKLRPPLKARPELQTEPAPPAAAEDAATHDALYRNGRLRMPPPLRGSHASLLRQNERNDAEGLERILDDNDLLNRVAHGFLVPIPVSAALTVNPKLPENRRYCRPWTAQFLTDLSRAHAAVFHSPLQINSAVRTVAYQLKLERINGNAAPAEGDIASPHLTGATIDIAKQGLTRPEIAWMRIHLLRLQQDGKLDVEEEFEQACFHITVYKTYTLPSLRLTPSEQTAASLAPAGSTGM